MHEKLSYRCSWTSFAKLPNFSRVRRPVQGPRTSFSFQRTAKSTRALDEALSPILNAAHNTHPISKRGDWTRTFSRFTRRCASRNIAATRYGADQCSITTSRLAPYDSPELPSVPPSDLCRDLISFRIPLPSAEVSLISSQPWIFNHHTPLRNPIQ
ncbi:hypothetical protein IG631_01027 [Alternaria alternata]|jgi:hypothetical protein|nr:hypothetical protein IG631_01027 [Alternaria alternata]